MNTEVKEFLCNLGTSIAIISFMVILLITPQSIIPFFALGCGFLLMVAFIN
jgi:hypothetical protein